MAATAKSRARVFRHFKRNQNQSSVSVQAFSTSATRVGESIGPDAIGELEPGYAQLYSYYEPGLQGGTYEINVDHRLNHPDFPSAPKVPKDKNDTFTPTQTANPSSTQFFKVNVARFSLPTKIIHQTYPPQGLADHNNILPHIVFEDVHFPWENEGSPIQDKIDNADDHDKTKRSRSKVPWIALWTFQEDEIKLSEQELKGKSQGGLFPDTIQIPSHGTPAPTDREQDKATFSVRLTMDEYLEMGGWPKHNTRDSHSEKVTIPHFDNNGSEKIDRKEQVNVVFVKREVFESHVCSYKADGSERAPNQSGIPDVSRYKYLAHVRNVNQIAMAGLDLPDKGLYSVIHGHRTGPLDITGPKPVIVHLVSIMDIEDNIRLPLDPNLDKTKWVAMISLHSWTYLCLPPATVNFVDTMRGIGHTIKEEGAECWLRAPDDAIRKAAGILTSPPNAPKEAIGRALGAVTTSQKASLNYRLATRLFDGFSLQRYLLQTGEQTVALYRGPLTSTYVPPMQTRRDGGWWPLQSNFSSDYQILDPNLGIMDITYSAAWQLGRTLGIADQAFTAALVRLRSTVVTKASRDAKKDIVGSRSVKTKATTLNSLATSLDTLARLGDTKAGKELPFANRAKKSVNPAPQIKIINPASDHLSKPATAFKTVEKERIVLQQKFMAVASSVAAANVSQDDGGPEVFIPFNEINVPSSPDWQIVQAWVLDKLSLHNIPAHYMISDPSCLPPDSIRFFYIDENWFDAFIDGALSIGNHLDQEDDVVRQAFKRQLNRYFAAPLGDGNLNYVPQIPTFGYFLRSGVVKAFPNLEVHAPWPSSENMGGNRMETVRLDCLEKDTLLCLFDRAPGQTYWNKDQGDGSVRTDITICQPPHQQCFRLGTEASKGRVQMQYRTAYTKEPTDLEPGLKIYDSLCIINWNADGDPKLVVDKRQEAAAFVQPKHIFDHETNMLIFPAFAQSCIDVLNSQMERPNDSNGTTKYFEDTTPSSAVCAVILNSFVSVMNINLPQAATTTTSEIQTTAPRDTTITPRQIRVAEDADADRAKWKIVPPDDPGDSVPTPKPRPPPPSVPGPPPPPPAPPSKKPTLLPIGWSNESAVKFPDSERTELDPKTLFLRSPTSSQWSCDAFVLGVTSNPKFEARNPVPLFPASHKQFGIPMDLIVRIVQPANGQNITHKLQIFSIEMELLLGTKPEHLMAKYDGPGASMLNNQKWNVHVSFGSNPDKVVFTLIPRSTTKLSPMRVNWDLTFAIWGFLPNGVPGKVDVKIRENYRYCDKRELGGQVQKVFANAECNLEKIRSP